MKLLISAALVFTLSGLNLAYAHPKDKIEVSVIPETQDIKTYWHPDGHQYAFCVSIRSYSKGTTSVSCSPVSY